jgi:hypothetical protein
MYSNSYMTVKSPLTAFARLLDVNNWLQVGRVLSFAAMAASLVACGPSYQKREVFAKTVELPSGRFVGPIDVELPTKPSDSATYMEVVTELQAACTPRLRISFPDGEVADIGADDSHWQALLARRADGEASPKANGQGSTASGERPAASDERPAANGQLRTATVQPGHWQQVHSESWPGQLEFLHQRDQRCAGTRVYRHRYLTGVQDRQQLSIWGQVPQELAGARLTVRVREVVDLDHRQRLVEARIEARRNAEREARERAARAERRRRRAERRAEKIRRRNAERRARPRPPKPEPKGERPKKAKAEGARWVGGYWAWHGSKGKWVWQRGHWGRPARAPALRREDHGRPPVAGCTWQHGHWVWRPGNGSWRWVPGHWNAPPPKLEEPGQPPVPESDWIAGQWISVGTSFRWIPGRWGRPKPRVEIIPPPPRPGAQWVAGAWVRLSGKWTWMAGYYRDAKRKPPARKVEQPGPKPEPGAQWLAGYWRWDGARYQWMAGHWERPPGEGYVWVPDPVDPVAGVVLGGRWVLRVEIGGPR